VAPALRKLVLTAHVVVSVGWLGAVAGFLVLAVAVLTSEETETVRGAYLAMDLMGWLVLVPLAFASLLTGLVQSLGTHWGLFRHYWILFKLLINVVATVVLLMYTRTLDSFAETARESDHLLRSASPVLHASAALVLLLVATTLAVYKPRGLTPYGQRKQRESVQTSR
jgi:MFS family permease